MNTSLEEVRMLLAGVLGLGKRAELLNEDSPLLGAIPEFDSMAVVSVLTAIEEQYGVVIEDDDVTAETFETVGSLARFLDHICA